VATLVLPEPGKTSVATRLARRHGLRVYSSDNHTWAHRDRALAAGNAAAQRWEALSPDERTALAGPDLLETSLHRERGAMVVEDVHALPPAPLVVAEGSVITPSSVPDLSRAVWLVPTREQQRRRLQAREGVAVRLYLLLASEIERETVAHGACVVDLDGSQSIADVVDHVERLFANVLATAPKAETVEQRRELLREANLARVEQVRAFHRRPWATGDSEARVRTFICECGDAACEDDLQATVAEAAAAPLLAPGHA